MIIDHHRIGVSKVLIRDSVSTSLAATNSAVTRTLPPSRTVDVSNGSLQTSSASSASITVPKVTVSASASQSLSATGVGVTRNPPPSRTVSVSNGQLQRSTASDVNVTVPNDPPFASLTVTTTSNAREAEFDASGSEDPNADNLLYRYDPGDGSGFGAFTTSDVVTHTYSSSGTYTVTVEVIDGKGGSDTANDTVTIFGISPLITT